MASSNKASNLIRKRISVPLAFALILLLILCGTGIYRAKQENIFQQTESTFDKVSSSFYKELENESGLLEGLAEYIKNQNNIRRAWTNKDIKELNNLVNPVYKDIISKYSVCMLNFHSLDKNCILSIPPHNCKEPTHKAVEKSRKTGKSYYSLETGTDNILTLRYSTPWVRNGKVTGYIEIGETISFLPKQIAALEDVEIITVIDKKHLDLDNWQNQKSHLEKPGQWDEYENFVVIDSTTKEINPKLQKHINTIKPGKTAKKFKLNSTQMHFRGMMMPIFNLNGDTLGQIIAVYDVSRDLADLQYLIVYLFIGGVSVWFVILAPSMSTSERSNITLRKLTKNSN